MLLLKKKFNQALIYYSQIEDLKNDVVAHEEASLKLLKRVILKLILCGH
jgi:hypothetical protein